MERLKELATWVILVIAFYLFSNGMIYLYLNNIKNSQTHTKNTQIVMQEKK